MLTSWVSAISAFASGSIQVVTKDAMSSLQVSSKLLVQDSRTYMRHQWKATTDSTCDACMRAKLIHLGLASSWCILRTSCAATPGGMDFLGNLQVDKG